MRIFFCMAILLFNSSSYSQIYRCNDGLVEFRSDAEREMIKVYSKQLTGVLDTAKKVFAFAIKVNSFDGFNAALQKEHFNETYMESSKYPRAVYTGKIIEDINFSKDSSYTVRTKGSFEIHGVKQERIIKSKLNIYRGVISIESNFTVFLKDYNIKIPKVVHENIAAEIEVRVHADLKSANN